MQEESEQKKIYYKKIEKSLERCNIMVSEILRDKNKKFLILYFLIYQVMNVLNI